MEEGCTERQGHQHRSSTRTHENITNARCRRQSLAIRYFTNMFNDHERSIKPFAEHVTLAISK
ncbi:hypothetical protein Scep_025893 [Stephania cephalantha]|uniref:Uncharacterized protein n=1 Tax=Stephania cephalantha TaxID=152367 RepID=A0AAP0HPS6_9MAGN